MERQQFLVLHHQKSKGCAVTLTHDPTVGRLSSQQWLQRHRCYVLKMRVNGVTMTFGHASWKIRGLFGDINPK